jgi:Predicted membrane protein (DUF2254)
VVEGTTLAWIWRAAPEDPAPDPQAFSQALGAGVRIGFERTLEQDAAFGIRQLVDVACKALSPAVNDPYTAVQAVDHLSVIFCALARRPLGNHVARDGAGAAAIIPGRRFGEYLAVMCGLIRRYGAGEPTVAHALLRLLGSCAAVAAEATQAIQNSFARLLGVPDPAAPGAAIGLSGPERREAPGVPPAGRTPTVRSEKDSSERPVARPVTHGGWFPGRRAGHCVHRRGGVRMSRRCRFEQADAVAGGPG